MAETTIRVNVHHVSIPPMSTLGYGEGMDEHGRLISFVGDARMMVHIGESLNEDEDTWAQVPLRNVTDIRLDDRDPAAN